MARRQGIWVKTLSADDKAAIAARDAIVHILVKPIGADLQTNLVMTTDRRTYHLEMRSSASTYMASESWTYPASELLALKKQRATAPQRVVRIVRTDAVWRESKQ